MLDANNLILATAYQINQNMRNNSLDLVPALYEKFVSDDTTYFNVRYNGYLGTLTITGNTVELAILAAIEGMVSFINPAMPNLLINFSRRALKLLISTHCCKGPTI